MEKWSNIKHNKLSRYIMPSIIKTCKLPEHKNFYSISRLKTYSECSKFYENRYINKIKVQDVSSSTLLGTLVHGAIEEYYLSADRNGKPDSLNRCFSRSSSKILLEMGLLEEEELNYISSSLNAYSLNIKTLYKKASKLYQGSDAIRTREGKEAKSPQATSAWKAEAKLLGLESSKRTIDTFFKGKLPTEISLAEVYAEALHLVTNYRHPRLITKVEAVEFPISHKDLENDTLVNPVNMPDEFGGEEDFFFNGYVDLIGETESGEKVIVDHKTSKKAYTEEDLKYNPQLIAYAWAYSVLTGDKVSYIGINNIRDREFVYTELPDDDQCQEILNSLFSNHKDISSCSFKKKAPEPYSPCLNMFGKPCPYLPCCWPDRANELGMKPILTKEEEQENLIEKESLTQDENDSIDSLSFI